MLSNVHASLTCDMRAPQLTHLQHVGRQRVVRLNVGGLDLWGRVHGAQGGNGVLGRNGSWMQVQGPAMLRVSWCDMNPAARLLVTPFHPAPCPSTLTSLGDRLPARAHAKLHAQNTTRHHLHIPERYERLLHPTLSSPTCCM